ncbi:hypothetical protein FA15DRAFT_669924 [Coprinopsis marcescibilis]|uniref:Uncharacterized protein n=1 Tax=Coprinopsis marcescibilis TaxID=230819 RepID=A0A5C3KV41_COPMA|nr:hypothetical protein FA15DRAFT_669924 [Coprinopsis marcescibilis]
MMATVRSVVTLGVVSVVLGLVGGWEVGLVQGAGVVLDLGGEEAGSQQFPSVVPVTTSTSGTSTPTPRPPRSPCIPCIPPICKPGFHSDCICRCVPDAVKRLDGLGNLKV